MNNLLKRLLGLGGGPDSGKLTYEQARELAQHRDPDVRRQVAARPDAPSEVLYYLADDPVPAVRQAIAANRSTPAKADLLLASDADETVRTGLAMKISRLAPGLDSHEQDRLRRMTYDALQLLARDQITRVRQIVAETLKDVANAPPEVIHRLARDAELAVAGPILECSPVLTDEDLLEIIESGPIKGALSAISRRAEVHAHIADAIAATDDVGAIAALLGNRSAQIREETLDRLIERAPEIEEWHAPLVHRPHLPAGAAVRLARFVADNLVQALKERRDLDPATAAAVAEAVHRRLDESGPGISAHHSRETQAVDKPLEAAKKMFAAGNLEEGLIASALASNDREFVIAALAVRSKLPVDLVRRVVGTRSAKGMVSVAWKAGMTMPFAVILQSKLARIPPADLFKPGKGNLYPMSPDEMAWQLKFFSGLQGDTATG